ncbi:MAG: hypothetical protein J7605_10725 [Variovorax sp.]|nr:hypothetical protein [Variovorax sp.]
MQRSVLFKGGVTKAAALLLAVSCMPDAIGGVINFSGELVVATYQVNAPVTLPAVASSSRNGWTAIGVAGDARNLPQVTARVEAVGRSELVVRCTDGRSGASTPLAGQGCRVGPDGRGLSIRPAAATQQDTASAAIVTLLYD